MAYTVDTNLNHITNIASVFISSIWDL